MERAHPNAAANARCRDARARRAWQRPGLGAGSVTACRRRTSARRGRRGAARRGHCAKLVRRHFPLSHRSPQPLSSVRARLRLHSARPAADASTPRVPSRYSRGAPDWRRWRLSPHQRVSRCWGVYSIANKVRLVETIQAARAAAVLPLLRSHADGDGDGSGGGGGSGLLPESYVWREFSHRPDWRALLGPAEGALLPPRRWLIKRAVHRGKVDASGFPSPRTRLEGWERLAEQLPDDSRTTQRRPSPVPSLACPTLLLLLPLLTDNTRRPTRLSPTPGRVSRHHRGAAQCELTRAGSPRTAPGRRRATLR